MIINLKFKKYNEKMEKLWNSRNFISKVVSGNEFFSASMEKRLKMKDGNKQNKYGKRLILSKIESGMGDKLGGKFLILLHGIVFILFSHKNSIKNN